MENTSKRSTGKAPERTGEVQEEEGEYRKGRKGNKEAEWGA